MPEFSRFAIFGGISPIMSTRNGDFEILEGGWRLASSGRFTTWFAFSRRLVAAQSSLTPAVIATLPHFSVSDAKERAERSAGERAGLGADFGQLLHHVRTPASPCRPTAVSTASTSGGVLAGATMPNQDDASKFATRRPRPWSADPETAASARRRQPQAPRIVPPMHLRPDGRHVVEHHRHLARRSGRSSQAPRRDTGHARCRCRPALSTARRRDDWSSRCPMIRNSVVPGDALASAISSPTGRCLHIGMNRQHDRNRGDQRDRREILAPDRTTVWHRATG